MGLERSLQRALAFDCEQLLARLYYCLDESRYADLVAVFASDGIWHRQGKALKGHAEILAALKARPATQVTRHVISNIWVSVADDGSMNSVGYLMPYVHTGDEVPRKPIPIRFPTRLLVMETRFLRAGDSCVIAEHKVRPELEFPKNA